MVKRLAAKGLGKPPSQTPAEFASTITVPQVRENAQQFTECYECARFSASAEDAERLRVFFAEPVGKR
jgi:hypothetical protein